MRLIALALPRVRRLIPSGQGLVTLLLVMIVVSLELVGRHAKSDWHDLLAVLLLSSCVALVVMRHKRQPLTWVIWLTSQFGRLDRVRYEHGLDLRGSPRLPSRLPPMIWILLVGLTTWSLMATAAWWVFPDGWREIGVRTSYVLYLVLLVALWSALILCTLAGLFLPVLFFDRTLRKRSRGSDRRGLELALLAGYMMIVVSVAQLVPTVFVLGLCVLVALWALVAVSQGGREEPAMLWRSRNGRPIFSVPLRRIVAGGLGLISFAVFNLLLTSCGGRLLSLPDKDDPMLLTTLLGTVAAWMIPGLVIATALRLWAGRRIDPAARTTPTVHIHSQLPMSDVKKAAAIISGWGWIVRTTSGPISSNEVGIELVLAEQSDATEFDPIWPLKVSYDDLSSERVKDRLDRRDEIVLRRYGLRGVKSLFKRALSERRVKGGGYWFAPHWWFITGMDREEPHRGRGDYPTPPKPVGQPFHRIFGPRVRQHFHTVLRAVEIDMIFIEDGVSPRTFAKVLRIIFELYDKHSGQRKAEDHSFHSIPKIRVMVHEYTPGKPFQTTNYNEPQFDELSRARVLHIFRDNGDHEAPVEMPFDFSWEPSPVLGIG